MQYALENWSALKLVGFITAGFLFRYALLAVLAYLAFWSPFKTWFAKYRVSPNPPTGKDGWREFKASMSMIGVFSFFGVLIQKLYQHGHTQLYFEVSQFGIPYLLLSCIGIILLNDVYYYFTHRALHTPLLYQHIHRVHHLTRNPTPLSCFALHPLEGVVQGAFATFIVVLFPLHPIALAWMQTVFYLVNVIGHFGHEFFGRTLDLKSSVGWINSSTSHYFHHQLFNKNYGLYTNIWDRLFKTLSLPKTQRAQETV